MLHDVYSVLPLSDFTLLLAELVDFSGAEGILTGVSSLTATIGQALRRQRGRPRKFAAPSRAVTLTLPESVLEALGNVHPDVSRAIVQLVNRRASQRNGRPPADLAVFDRSAVITVRPTALLKGRMGIDLVPLPDGRALISFEQGKTVADVELTIYDALADPKISASDQSVLQAIADLLTEARRSTDVTVVSRSIIVLESPPKSRLPNGVRSTRRDKVSRR